MKSIFYLLISIIFPLSVFAQKAIKPMVLLRVEGAWLAYNTEGKLCWEDEPLLFHNPRGYVNGLLCGSELQGITDLTAIYHQCLYDVKGAIAWSPNLDTLRYNIITPPDDLGFALLENTNTNERFICNKSGKIVSSADPTLQYLGNGIIITALPPDPERFDNQFFTFYDLITKKVLFETFAYSVHHLKEGIVCTEIKESQFDDLRVTTYLNLKGETIIPPQFFERIGDGETPFFKDGLIFLKDKNGTSVFDKMGKNILEKFVFKVERMSNSLIKVQENENNYVQIFKTDGSNFSEESYDEISDVNENGIFYVKKEGKFHLMNTEGKIIKTSLDYKQAFTSKTHVFMRKTASNYDIFDKKGLKTGNFKADTLINMPYGLTVFILSNQKGIINSEGKIVLKPANIDEITVQEDYILTTVKKENDSVNFSFYSKAGKLLLDDIMTKLKSDWIIPIEPREFYISF